MEAISYTTWDDTFGEGTHRAISRHETWRNEAANFATFLFREVLRTWRSALSSSVGMLQMGNQKRSWTNFQLSWMKGALGCMGHRSWLFERGIMMKTSKFKGCFTAATSKVETLCAPFLKCSCSSCFAHCLRWIVVCTFASLTSNRSRKFLLQSNSGQELTDDGCYEGEHPTQWR